MTLHDQFLPYCDHEFANREDNAENCVDLLNEIVMSFFEWLTINRHDQSFKDFTDVDFWNAFKIERGL